MDKMRWRYGEVNAVNCAVNADVAIEIGDLVYLTSGRVFPANLLTDPAEFKLQFLGVAMQRSRIGETHEIRIATTGGYSFDSVECAYLLGDLLGPVVEDGKLCNQKLQKVLDKSTAIARVDHSTEANAGSVLARIVSTALVGGV